jgi:hypothetical protein
MVKLLVWLGDVKYFRLGHTTREAAALWVAHASRVLVLASRRNNLFLCGFSRQHHRTRKSAKARRFCQHASRVRYRERPLPRAHNSAIHLPRRRSVFTSMPLRRSARRNRVSRSRKIPEKISHLFRFSFGKTSISNSL